ncbi:MAG TPA: hypothetical protein VH299_01220 [Solirubrobacterales bacterium]|jgi:hypothetical protein|nr:hypothetical protein [Solirubrobacterales bacterium]
MLKRTAGALIVAAALAVPASASANTDFLPPISPATAPPRTTYVVAGTPTALAPSVIASGDGSEGFDWGDAGIGAAAALAFTAAGGAVVFTRRRRPAGQSPA